jgi:uncharacterized protein
MNNPPNPILEAKRTQLQQQLPYLRQRYGVDHLWLFGSYVRQEQTASSDLDILVTFQRTPTLFEFVYLKDELSDLLGLPIDLVMESGLKPHVRQRILPELVAV